MVLHAAVRPQFWADLSLSAPSPPPPHAPLSSSGADLVVGDQLFHPFYLALVGRHGFVVHAVFQEVLLAVMNLSAVFQLEGAEGLQGPQQDLEQTARRKTENSLKQHLR